LAETSNDSGQEATPPETDDNAAPATSANKPQNTMGGRVTETHVSPRKTLKWD